MKEYSNDVRYEVPELRVVRACRGGLMAASPLTGGLENEIYSDGGGFGSWAGFDGFANDAYEGGLDGSWAGVHGSLGGSEGYDDGGLGSWGIGGFANDAYGASGVLGAWAGVSGSSSGEDYGGASDGAWAGVSGGPSPEGYTNVDGEIDW